MKIVSRSATSQDSGRRKILHWLGAGVIAAIAVFFLRAKILSRILRKSTIQDLKHRRSVSISINTMAVKRRRKSSTYV